MRLKICCCYCTDEGPTFSSGDSSNGTTLPRVVAEQPKLRQPPTIQLDEITANKSAVPNNDSSEEVVREADPDKVPHDIKAGADDEDIKSVTCTQPAPAEPKPILSPEPTVSASEENEPAKQQNEITSGAATTTATTEQNQSTVSFTVLAPGHFKSVYKGTEYHILNGEIVEVVGTCDESDREFIMAHYASAMQSVKQAMEGLEKGLLGIDREMMGTQVNAQNLAPNVSSLLAALHHPPPSSNPPRPPSPRVNRADFEKFLAYLRNEVRKEEEIKSVDDKAVSRKAQLVDKFCGIMSDVPMLEDDVDSATNNKNRLSEPVLEKTTFAAKVAVYEDPKTYEKLDEFEVPEAKRADEFIISRDECLSSGYYFHAAKPRRARRRALDGRARLQLASPDRYLLFQDECLKQHNKYRSMHGVPPLVNNDFLCKVAREWAEHLALKDAFYHRPNNEYGENLFSGDRIHVCARRAVAAWYDEIDLYDYNNPKFDKSTGHFTQLIWKDTVEMGTGVAQMGNKIWVCCNYNPPGNHLDKFNDEYVPRPVVINRKC